MRESPIYMDYQATTPLDPRVRESMEPYWMESFGNPHSEGHNFGWEARRAVETARGQVADIIGADDDEIFFVSGATESCNIALRGVAATAGKRQRIVTVETEHPAVLETVQWLDRNGFDIQVLPVTDTGLLDISVLENVLNEQTLLVSVMLANNEIGVIQPLARIAELCQSVGAFLHTDATQAVGRIAVNVDELGVDLLSLSGHKIYGPNGVGALYVRKRSDLCLEPIMTGGSQEQGVRPGTVATPLVVGLGAACEIADTEWESDALRLCGLTENLVSEMKKDFPSLRVFGDMENRIPGNFNFGLPGILAERLVEAVSHRIAISTGAACSTGSPEPSRVLMALNIDREIASCGVRISLGRFTTTEHVEVAKVTLRDALVEMRRD